MLSPKDIIRFTQPIKARLQIGYDAPYSELEYIILESDTVLQVSPYFNLYDNEYYFRCLETDKPEFIEKYFTTQQNKYEFYKGFTVSILAEDFENKYELLEKADLTKLDFSKYEDMSILVSQIWKDHKNINILPEELQKAFLSVFKEYEECIITSNEVYNRQLYLMGEYFKK